MRFSTVVLALAASAASVSGFALSPRQNGIPTCMMTCSGAALENSDCGARDNACMCQDAEFVDASHACILADCSEEDAAAAIEISMGICESVGFPVTSATGGADPTDAPTDEEEEDESSTSGSAADATDSTASQTTTSTKPGATSGTNTTANSTDAEDAADDDSGAVASAGAGAAAMLAALGLAALAL